MDLILLITAILLIVIIIIVYTLNTVKQTSDLDALFMDLLKLKPDAVSFCLGKNETTGKYRNVQTNEDGKAIIVEAEYPINLDGDFIILKDHGDITELTSGDGFKMSGVDLMEFKCPDGFEGINCTLKPLCSETDAGKYKALTYTQFNELGLYTNSFSRTPIETRASEPTHPRIRVLCLNTLGEYELQTCPNNTLLDADLKCQPYDICEDRINGYKHNYKISSTSSDLNKNEYYICDNNKSVLTTCADDTVFSMDNSGCVTESLCYNKGSETLPVDDNSYIQCANDQGTIVTCPDGIENIDGVLSCKVDTCIPEQFEYNDGMLQYVYGNTICTDGIADTKMCDNTLNPRVYNYEWAEKFTYSIDGWPTEIMAEDRTCIAPTDSIIIDPIIKLQWTDAMPEEHDYNILTEKYICPEGTKYIVDYKNQVMEPELSGIVDYLSPCQNDVADTSEINIPVFHYDFPTLYFILYGYRYIAGSDTYYFWPVKKSSSENVYIRTKLLISSGTVLLLTESSQLMPLGFSDPLESGDNKNLVYNGYTDFVVRDNLIYYFVISGRYEAVTLSDSTIVNAETITILSRVDTNRSIRFSVDMSQITSAAEILPGVTFWNKEFEINTTVYPAGLIIMEITAGATSADTATLNIGNIQEVQYIPNEYPEFVFHE